MQATERNPALEALRVNVIVGRAKIRLSQEQLAQRAGISRPTVSRIERMSGDVGVGVVQRIADALGTTVAALFAEPIAAAVGNAEIARRMASLPEERVDFGQLLDAMEEAAETTQRTETADKPTAGRYGGARRTPVAR